MKQRGNKTRNRESKSRATGLAWGVRAWAFLGWLACTVLILYGAVWLLSRTAGFRSLVEDRLSDRLGLDVSMDAAWLDRRLDLTLTGIVASEGGGGGDEAQVMIGHAFARWVFREGRVRPSSIELDEVRVRFVEGDEEGWHPRVLSPMAEQLLQMGGLGGVPAMMSSAQKPPERRAAPETGANEEGEERRRRRAFWTGMDLDIRGASIAWERAGEQVAILDGLAIQSRSVSFLERGVQYYAVSIGRAHVMGGREMEGGSFEALLTEGRNFILGPRIGEGVEVASSPEVERRRRRESRRRDEDLMAQASQLIERGSTARPERRVSREVPVPPRPPVVAGGGEAAPLAVLDESPPPVLPDRASRMVDSDVLEVVDERSVRTGVDDELFEIDEELRRFEKEMLASMEHLDEDESEALFEYIREALDFDMDAAVAP